MGSRTKPSLPLNHVSRTVICDTAAVVLGNVKIRVHSHQPFAKAKAECLIIV